MEKSSDIYRSWAEDFW